MIMKNRVGTSFVRTLMLLAALPALAGPAARMRAVIVPNSQADVTMSATGPQTVVPGGDLALFVVVSCAGPGTSGEVTYTWTTPPGTAYLFMDTVAVDPPPAPAPTDCTTPAAGSAGTVTCTVPSLAPPGSGPYGGGTLSIEIIHMRVLASSGSLTNTVTATAANDPNLSNNTSSATTAIVGPVNADVSVVLTGPDVIGPDGVATYGVTAHNQGPASASNIELEFFTQTGVSIDSYTAVGLDCFQSATIPPFGLFCNTTTAPPGWLASLTVNTHALVPASGAVTASAHIGADTGDPDRSNNDASFTSLLNPPTRLALQFDPPTVDALPSQPFTFTARLNNMADLPLGEVDVIDVAPPGLVFVSATPSSGTCTVTASTIQCHINGLVPGISTIAIVATAATPGTLVNQIDANTAALSASATVSIDVLPSSRHHAARH